MRNQYEHKITGKRGLFVKLNHIWRILTNKNYFLISFELDTNKNVKGITLRTYNTDENAVKDISHYVYETIQKSQEVSKEANDILKSIGNKPPLNLN